MLDAALPLDHYRALELNGDGRPKIVDPLSTLSWQDAVRGVLGDKYSVLAEYDVTVRSPSTIIRLPSVVMAREYVNLESRPAAWTRWNVMLAYGFRCAYCNHKFPTKELTYDHIIPKSRGGGSGWGNIITACLPCNMKKANRTPLEAGMPLMFEAKQPTQAKLNAKAMSFLRERKDIHKDWIDFLYWDTTLED